MLRVWKRESVRCEGQHLLLGLLERRRRRAHAVWIGCTQACLLLLQISDFPLQVFNRSGSLLLCGESLLVITDKLWKGQSRGVPV